MSRRRGPGAAGRDPAGAGESNGLTAYLRSPAKGWWAAPDGHTEQDDVVMVEVVTNTFDRAWWRTYAATLAARAAQAESMAAPLARLERRATAAGVPTMYVNDNFGQWRSDFRRTVAHCTALSSPRHRVSRRLRPTARDYFMLKPKHSGFFDMREYKIFAPADCLVSNTAADNDHAPYQLKTVLKGNVAVSTRLTFQAHGRPHHARRR